MHIWVAVDVKDPSNSSLGPASGHLVDDKIQKWN